MLGNPIESAVTNNSTDWVARTRRRIHGPCNNIGHVKEITTIIIIVFVHVVVVVVVKVGRDEIGVGY